MPSKNKIIEINTKELPKPIDLFHYSPGTPIPSGWDIVVNIGEDGLCKLVYSSYGVKSFHHDCRADKEITFAKYKDDRRIAMLLISTKTDPKTRLISTIKININKHIVKSFAELFKAHFTTFPSKEITYINTIIIQQEYMNNRVELNYFIKRFQHNIL